MSLKILFVCIGNTCRSPMAESVMSHYIETNNLKWEIDSAALRTWNIGRSPEERCLKVLEENGLSTKHVARMITDEDFATYDYILAMDETNMEELNDIVKRIGEKSKTKVQLLGSYNTNEDDKVIKDPYFSTGMTGFRCAYVQINESCKQFIEKHTKIPKNL